MIAHDDVSQAPRAGESGDLLRITDLHVEFRVDGEWSPALRGVDLFLPPGGSLALVGESGSGKSVTAISVVGLIPRNGRLTRGAIHLADTELTTLSPAAYRKIRGSEIGFVFQDPLSSLNPVLTVGRQLTEQMKVHGIADDPKEAGRRATHLLDRVGIVDPPGALKRFPFEFSGGMRQRIALAIALSCEPSLLIADEPTTALDVTVQAQILDLLREVQEERNLGLIFITHDLGVASIVADRVAVMYAGQVVESGPVSEVNGGGLHPYTKGLWDSMPLLESDRIPEGIPGRPPTAAELGEGCTFGPRCRHFLSPACEQPQPLRPATDQHSVRCARWEELNGWHAARTGHETAAPPAGPAVELVRAVVEFRPRHRRRGSLPLRALDGVTIQAVAGRTIGVVGESGSGKSTMARTMVRINRPSEGRVLMGGVDITDLAERDIRPLRRRVQMVFQDPFSSLDPRQTVGKILAEPLETHDLAVGAEGADRVLATLGAVGLPASAMGRYPHEFSGGQRQRIAIARALMSEPDVVICDEPVSALDVSVQAQVLRLLADIQTRTGVGYVFIAHDLAVVGAVADEVHVMYGGVIVESGPTRQVLTDPQHPYTAGLVASVPSVRLSDPAFAVSRDITGEPPDPSALRVGCRFAARCWLRKDLGEPSECTTVEPLLAAIAPGRVAACHFASMSEGDRLVSWTAAKPTAS